MNMRIEIDQCRHLILAASARLNKLHLDYEESEVYLSNSLRSQSNLEDAVALDPNVNCFWQDPDESVTDVRIPKLLANWISTNEQAIKPSFCGLILNRGHALLDTGAKYGVSGTRAFRELEREIGNHTDQEGKPLKCNRVDGPATTGGIGGSAKVKFCALCPYGLGYETSGIFLILVLDDENCPTLFPIGLCYQLGMILDTNTSLAHWKRLALRARFASNRQDTPP
jgi:hypothetical protein